MKRTIWVLITLLIAQQSYAQQVSSIRADSVRLYNICDTAELILENKTKDTLGFLLNKGNGRTEFHRVKLKDLGGNKIAIVGQDTISVNPFLMGAIAVDSLWIKNDSVAYRANNKYYAVFSPSELNTLTDVKFTTREDNNYLQYNLTLNKWENRFFSDTTLGRGVDNAESDAFRFSVSKNRNAIYGHHPNPDTVGVSSVSLLYGRARSYSSIAIGMQLGNTIVYKNAIRGIAIGESKVSKDNGIAIDTKYFTNGVSSIAMGSYSNTDSDSSIAVGISLVISNNSSGALGLGRGHRLSGANAISIGIQTITRGNSSLAIGTSTQALGQGSIAIGRFAYAAGLGSVAIGSTAIAKADGCMVLHDYNSIIDSANVVNSFNARYHGGFQFHTNQAFALKQYSTEKGKIFFNADKDNTTIGYYESPSTSKLAVNGSLALPIKKVSANTTLGVDDYTVISTNAATLALPPASPADKRVYILKNASATGITVTASPGIRITSSVTTSSYALPSGSCITVQSDGSDWWIVN